MRPITKEAVYEMAYLHEWGRIRTLFELMKWYIW